MRKTSLLLAFVLLAVCASLVAQDASKASKAITADSFHGHIKFLADPKLEGRLPGSEGAKKASDYIAEKLKSFGVEPKGDKDTYFQKVAWKHGDKEYKCRNVAGVIPGNDKKLKDEIIVIVAHYDHVGKGVYGVRKEFRGKLIPGANDNASGTAGLLEVARAIMEGKLELKRSVLLLATTGEEAGLRGSKHYVAHPAFPLKKTMVVINLDQIGGYGRGVAAMGAHMSPQFDEGLDEALKGEDIKVSRQRIPGSGDNNSFNARYVPSLFFWTGYGDHYHSPTDTPENINREKGAAICRVVVRLVAHLADAEEIKSGMEKPRGTARPYLGISTDEAREGVEVTGVGKDSPADKGGLKKGDIITAIAGRKVTSYRAFIKELNKHKPDEKVKISVKRGKETKELEITLGQR